MPWTKAVSLRDTGAEMLFSVMYDLCCVCLRALQRVCVRVIIQDVHNFH